jgi:hypothetical protein
LGEELNMHHRPGGNRGHQFRDPLVAAEIEHGRRVRSSGGASMLAIIGIYRLLLITSIGIYRLMKFVWSKVRSRPRVGNDVIDSSSEGIQYKVYDPDRDD